MPKLTEFQLMDLWNMFKVPLSLELIEEYSIVCMSRKVVVAFLATPRNKRNKKRQGYASMSFSEKFTSFLFTQHLLCLLSFFSVNTAPKKTFAATVTIGGVSLPVMGSDSQKCIV